LDHDQTDAANLRCRRNPPSTSHERALAAQEFALLFAKTFGTFTREYSPLIL